MKNSQNLGVRKMNTLEMKETNGGWIPGWVNRILEDWLGNELPPNN